MNVFINQGIKHCLGLALGILVAYPHIWSHRFILFDGILSISQFLFCQNTKLLLLMINLVRICAFEALSHLEQARILFEQDDNHTKREPRHNKKHETSLSWRGTAGRWQEQLLFRWEVCKEHPQKCERSLRLQKSEAERLKEIRDLPENLGVQSRVEQQVISQRLWTDQTGRQRRDQAEVSHVTCNTQGAAGDDMANQSPVRLVSNIQQAAHYCEWNGKWITLKYFRKKKNVL